MTYALYIASILGALALLLMMPRRKPLPGKLGALLGGATLGGLWLYLAKEFPANVGLNAAGMGYYYVFSAIAIASAVRVITHKKPIYSALWFVMVVLASSGLFLVLGAEFISAAMVIIYGGAILVTYLFVIMLAADSVIDLQKVATQSEHDTPPPGTAEEGAEHDRVSREPAAAVIVGFLLLAVLLTVAFKPMAPNEFAKAPTDASIIEKTLHNRPASFDGNAVPALNNSERIGLDLFRSHPLGLELAGVILLVSLVGAVVIARKRVENEHHSA